MDTCTCTLNNLCPIARDLMKIEEHAYKEFCETKPASINLWTEYYRASHYRRVHRDAMEVRDEC